MRKEFIVFLSSCYCGMGYIDIYIYISYRVWKIIGEKSQGGLNSMELEDNLHSTLS